MPQDLVQLYPLDGRLLTLRTTEDDSSTRVLLQLREASTHAFAQRIVTELDVSAVQGLAGALLQWLAAGGHDLPELPVFELEDEDENPHRSETPPRPDQAGTLTLLHIGDRVLIQDADPWVVVSGTVLELIGSGTVPGASASGATFAIEDSAGARVQYEVVQPAGLGSMLCRRTSWRPALPDVNEQPATVHVVPEHTRG